MHLPAHLAQYDASGVDAHAHLQRLVELANVGGDVLVNARRGQQGAFGVIFMRLGHAEESH